MRPSIATAIATKKDGSKATKEVLLVVPGLPKSHDAGRSSQNASLLRGRCSSSPGIGFDGDGAYEVDLSRGPGHQHGELGYSSLLRPSLDGDVH